MVPLPWSRPCLAVPAVAVPSPCPSLCLACPGHGHRHLSPSSHADSAAGMDHLLALLVCVSGGVPVPRGAARPAPAPVAIGMLCPDGMSLLLRCSGPSVLRGIKISGRFARGAVSTCCGSLWCAAGGPASHGTASACVSALAQCLCEGTAFVHSRDCGHSWAHLVSTGVLAGLVPLL